MPIKASSGPKPLRDRCSEVSSSVAQDQLGALIARVAQGERITITRYGEPQAVLVPVSDLTEILKDPAPDLTALEADFDRRVASMRSSHQTEALRTVFSLSGAEMGRAALAQAKKDSQ